MLMMQAGVSAEVESTHTMKPRVGRSDRWFQSMQRRLWVVVVVGGVGGVGGVVVGVVVGVGGVGGGGRIGVYFLNALGIFASAAPQCSLLALRQQPSGSEG